MDTDLSKLIEKLALLASKDSKPDATISTVEMLYEKGKFDTLADYVGVLPEDKKITAQKRLLELHEKAHEKVDNAKASKPHNIVQAHGEYFEAAEQRVDNKQDREAKKTLEQDVLTLCKKGDSKKMGEFLKNLSEEERVEAKKTIFKFHEDAHKAAEQNKQLKDEFIKWDRRSMVNDR